LASFYRTESYQNLYPTSILGAYHSSIEHSSPIYTELSIFQNYEESLYIDIVIFTFWNKVLNPSRYGILNLPRYGVLFGTGIASNPQDINDLASIGY